MSIYHVSGEVFEFTFHGVKYYLPETQGYLENMIWCDTVNRPHVLYHNSLPQKLWHGWEWFFISIYNIL